MAVAPPATLFLCAATSWVDHHQQQKKEAVIAFITSSLRIDSLHAANVGTTIVNFDLATHSANTTHIFLDTSSIKRANAIATSK